MSRGPDATTLLRRAVERDAAAHGCSPLVEVLDMIRWASATFTGARHRLRVRAATSPMFDGWLATLADAELPLRGHLVADLVILAVTHERGAATAEIEALTVED